jgi:bacterioferritin
MQGDPRVVELLNQVLSAELTAVNQYFLHAKMQANWGFRRLHDVTRGESIDEMKHAEMLIERILFLEGVPNVQRLFAIKIGETVAEQLQLDVALEYESIKRLNDGIALAVEAGDNATREMLEGILVSEEEHTDWLETQLGAIGLIGVENYLAQQLYD